MEINRCVVGAVGTNCYIVSDETTKDALIIDPGADAARIAAVVREKQLVVRAILLTHGHFDHMLAAKELCAEFSVKLYCFESERELMEDPVMNVGRMFRYECSVSPDEVFADREQLTYGSLSCKVIHTPGHTRGCVCFYFEPENVLFSGDTLFFESVGRTDMPTGNARLLVEKVRERLWELPDATKVYPGHGEPTSIGYEKRNNPYISEDGAFY